MLPIRINASDQVHQGFKCESGSEARPSIAPGLMVGCSHALGPVATAGRSRRGSIAWPPMHPRSKF